MGKPNSRKHIEERREQILLLLSKGYSQMEICKELNITRQTISSDMIFGNIGDTKMFGGKDDDLIVAGPGNDLVDGGPDDDVLLAGVNNNSVH